ncbi:MAG: HPr family phosphocarrier protein [Thermoguttaceae bacterium]
MSEPKATRTVRVINPQGVHLRAATLIAEVVRSHQSKVTLRKGSERVEGTDVLQIVTLGAGEGDEVLLEAAGSDAEAVLAAVAALFDGRFGHEDDDARP